MRRFLEWLGFYEVQTQRVTAASGETAGGETAVDIYDLLRALGSDE